MEADRVAEDATLYFGNGFDFLASLEDGAVDCVISDPPYAEQTHKGARSMKGRRDLNPAAFVHFEHFTDDQFITLCRESVRVARRWVIFTCDWKHAALLSKTDLPLIRVGVWVKPNAAPQFSGDRPAHGFETVVILHRPGKMKWNGGGKHAVWDYPVARNAQVPSEKPVKFIQRLIADFTNAGETVLDPMMGSATTGIAALSLDRRFIGCEIHPEHYAIAHKRIQQFSTQIRMPLEFA